MCRRDHDRLPRCRRYVLRLTGKCLFSVDLSFSNHVRTTVIYIVIVIILHRKKTVAHNGGGFGSGAPVARFTKRRFIFTFGRTRALMFSTDSKYSYSFKESQQLLRRYKKGQNRARVC